MHLQPFRPLGGATAPRWLQFWVLLLLVPACFALVTMPMPVAAVAIISTFGLPLAIWLAVHVHAASEFSAQVPAALRFAAGVSVTGLGLVGLFVFSAALALPTLAAYVVTVGLMATWGNTPSSARPGATTASIDETPSAPDDEEAEPTGVVVTHDLVRRMTDAELCHAWRRSFVTLQQARGLHLRARVVQARQLLLDEVDARHPAELQAWLVSGARAAGGPDRFIGPTGGGSGHPETD